MFSSTSIPLPFRHGGGRQGQINKGVRWPSFWWTPRDNTAGAAGPAGKPPSAQSGRTIDWQHHSSLPAQRTHTHHRSAFCHHRQTRGLSVVRKVICGHLVLGTILRPLRAKMQCVAECLLLCSLTRKKLFWHHLFIPWTWQISEETKPYYCLKLYKGRSHCYHWSLA